MTEASCAGENDTIIQQYTGQFINTLISMSATSEFKSCTGNRGKAQAQALFLIHEK